MDIRRVFKVFGSYILMVLIGIMDILYKSFIDTINIFSDFEFILWIKYLSLAVVMLLIIVLFVVYFMYSMLICQWLILLIPIVVVFCLKLLDNISDIMYRLG